MAIVTDGLVLYLHGACGKNNPATRVWKDLSGNGNDGELVNFGYIEDSGWVDGGLRFDGVDDWVEVDNVNTGNSNFTVEMICDIQSDGGYFAFKNQDDNWNFLVQRRTSTSYRVRTWTWLDGVMVGTNYSLIPLENGTLCFRVLDRVLSVFMNGEKKQEIFLEEFDPFAKLIIGSYTGGGPNHIRGIVNTFKLYNRALTDEEILQNYQAGHEWTPQIGKREITTTMKPITTSLSRKGKGKRELISTMKPITTSLERKGVGKREVITTMKPITSSLSRKGVGRREVITTMQPITSSISKKLPPIHANMDIRERIPKLEVD